MFKPFTSITVSIIAVIPVVAIIGPYDYRADLQIKEKAQPN